MSSAMALDPSLGLSRKRGPSPSRDDSMPPRDAPLSKRFRGLTLRGNRFRDRITKNSSQRRDSPASSIRSKLQDAGSDFMQMDDSPNKVYVFDLDEEAQSDGEADDESEDVPGPSMVFLPDIEKKFNKIPSSVLKSGGSTQQQQQQPPQPHPSTDVILYRDPVSLIAPTVEQESVRKMLLRAREQARQKTVQPPVQPVQQSFYQAPPVPSFQPDPDAMDMD